MSTSTISSLIAVGVLMVLVLLFAILILVKRQTTYVLVSETCQITYIMFAYILYISIIYCILYTCRYKM